MGGGRGACMQRRLTYNSATTVPVIQPPTPSSGVTASPPAEPSARGHPGRPGPQNPPVEGGVREGRERGAITQLFGSAWGSKSSCGRRTSKGHYTVIRVGVCPEGVGLQRMYTGNTPISVGTYRYSTGAKVGLEFTSLPAGVGQGAGTLWCGETHQLLRFLGQVTHLSAFPVRNLQIGTRWRYGIGRYECDRRYRSGRAIPVTVMIVSGTGGR